MMVMVLMVMISWSREEKKAIEDIAYCDNDEDNDDNNNGNDNNDKNNDNNNDNG